MIAAMLLRKPVDARALFAPFRGDDPAAAVGGRFLQARRFRENKYAQDFQHLRQTRLEEAQQGRGGVRFGHRVDMLTVPCQRCKDWAATALLRI